MSMTTVPSNKLVTVFGGSGFLGRHIVRALANDGWRIRVGVRKPNSALFLRPAGRVGQIQIVKANVLDENAVYSALDGAEAAINLVGILFERGGQRFEAIHVRAATNIAQAAAKHGTQRLLHVSALGASLSSAASYSRTKAEGEVRVREAHPRATVFRPSIVFGPEDDFFNRFAALARLSPALPLIGGGKTRFQPVYVADVARATVAALRDPATAGNTYELGGPEILSLREVFELVLKVTHRRRLLMPVPFGIARIQAAFLGLLPKPPLTLDQVRMLETDNVVTPGAPGLGQLGITPEGAEAILESYLWRFRKEGEFAIEIPEETSV
jgi:NADH dehydrogenase